MHDISDLEDRGLPGVFVATTEFVRAADVQSRALGIDSAAVYVAHPVQDRTDDEMVAMAEAAAAETLAALMQS